MRELKEVKQTLLVPRLHYKFTEKHDWDEISRQFSSIKEHESQYQDYPRQKFRNDELIKKVAPKKIDRLVVNGKLQLIK